MLQISFIIILAAVSAFALWKGGRDERRVALTCVLGTIATHFAISPLQERYANVELGVILVDCLVLAGFVVVALQSIRFWPLWVAGLQLTTVMGHIMKGVDAQLLPVAYGAALTLWSYPIILILAVGTWRYHRRWLSAQSPARFETA